jgi:hypothetical protein
MPHIASLRRAVRRRAVAARAATGGAVALVACLDALAARGATSVGHGGTPWVSWSSTAHPCARDLLEALVAERSSQSSSSRTAISRRQPRRTNAQLVHDVLLEEVDADAQGVGRLLLRQGQAAERGVRRARLLVVESLPLSGHAPLSYEGRSTPLPITPWERRGNGAGTGAPRSGGLERGPATQDRLDQHPAQGRETPVHAGSAVKRRRGRDSNPRWRRAPTTVFEDCAVSCRHRLVEPVYERATASWDSRRDYGRSRRLWDRPMCPPRGATSTAVDSVR